MALDKQPPAECEAFVDIHNMITCDVDAMKAFVAVAQKQ